jgi:hypothetical protein
MITQWPRIGIGIEMARLWANGQQPLPNRVTSEFRGRTKLPGGGVWY